MLERCIVLESSYIPAYLDLFKLHRGIAAAKILRNAIKANPTDIELRIKLGYWLLDNGNNCEEKRIPTFLR